MAYSKVKDSMKENHRFLGRFALAATIAAVTMTGFAGVKSTGPSISEAGPAITDQLQETNDIPENVGGRGQIVRVLPGETMATIMKRLHPGLAGNLDFYLAVLRANGQDPEMVRRVYPRQDVYIPEPGRETYGLALGEEAVGVGFHGSEKTGGRHAIQMSILGEAVVLEPGEKDVMVGDEIVALSESGGLVRYRLTAYLPEMPQYQVLQRIVIERAKLPSE